MYQAARTGMSDTAAVESSSYGGAPAARPEFDLDGFLDYGHGAREPLAPDARAAAEASYGVSLGDVSIVRGTPANDVQGMADGRTVALAPDVPNSKNVVLMHELAHLAQPSAGGEGLTRAGAAEDDADRAALGAMMGVPAAPTATRPGASAYATDEHVKVGDSADTGPGNVTINGVVFTMGQLNAIADYVANPDALYEMSVEHLELLRSFIIRDTEDPGSVLIGEWEQIPGVDYVDLSLTNDEHFAPTDETIAPGAGGEDHGTTWEGYYRNALEAAASGGGGDPAETQRIWADVAFSEHYLTDAFAAGHLFNKTDVMAQAQARIAALDEDAQWQMFSGVADAVLAAEPGIVGAYQIATPIKWVSATTAFVFRRFVLEVYNLRPDVVLNGIAMAAHDTLNAGGVTVENDLEAEPWVIQGDDHINPATAAALTRALERHRELVQLTITGDGPGVDEAIQEAQGFFPRPTADGHAAIVDAVEGASDPARDMQATLAAALTSKIASVLAAAAETSPDKVRLRPGAEVPGDPEHEEPEGDDPFEDPDCEQPAARTHVVQAGEWLSTIAEQYYGDMMKYGEIFEANKDRIDGFTDPDRIEVGWELVIP